MKDLKIIRLNKITIIFLNHLFHDIGEEVLTNNVVTANWLILFFISGVWAELLLSFSILSNGRAILSTQKPNDGALTCLHGMRY